MHLEVLVEDSSRATLIEMLLPAVIGPQGEPHTWRVHAYKGIGRIPAGLSAKRDPAKKVLLDRLPGMLVAHGKTPGIDAVVVVLDTDQRDCKAFLKELQAMVRRCRPAPSTLFRLAIEEMEAWLLGDRQAVLKAYPRAKKGILDRVRTAFAARGNCWQMPFTLEVLLQSRRQAGPCPDRSNTNGRNESDRIWISTAISLQASASCEMVCDVWWRDEDAHLWNSASPTPSPTAWPNSPARSRSSSRPQPSTCN